MSLKHLICSVYFSFLLSILAFGSVPDKHITVFSIGDASMAEYPVASAGRSWMQMLPMFFGIDFQFHNYAISKKSADDFLSEGHWDKVSAALNEGDYVFIGFDLDSVVSTSAKKAYQNALSRFVTDIKQKKGIPVLFTLISKGKQNDTDLANQLIKEVAEKNEVAYVDLQKSAGDLLENRKSEESIFLTVNEAIAVARIAARSIEAQFPDFELVNHKIKPVNADVISSGLKQEAALDFELRQLPVTKSGWERYRKNLRAELLKASGAIINHSLPLDYHETGRIQMNGYTIRKIYFQTRPNVYATANLYVPDGKGVFPAVINMHGHWMYGKAGDMVQSCAHELALNGYVCLNIDAWGAGERTSVHGVHEYHGSNLGASLMNIGESLLGNQLSDNLRGVDLLSTLPFVDGNNIGATGASGGGNQTMWLAAIDERIKAAMPVVSVGTFQSYIMGSNCVCELMPGGLTLTEESGVLAMVAPRAMKICSGLQDASTTFYPSEMKRSFTNAAPIFSLYDKKDQFQYQLFNTPHGYWPEMRQAMLSWFDLNLKGIKSTGFKAEIPFELLPEEQLMVFSKGKRSPLLKGTAEYCSEKGEALSTALYKQTAADKDKKLKELHDLLLLPVKSGAAVKLNEQAEPGGWHHIVLQTTQKHLIPLQYFPAKKGNNRIVLIFGNEQAVLKTYLKKGDGIILADLWGIGENASAGAKITDGSLPPFHTLARAELWLGRTIMGEWVSDLEDVVNYVHTNYKPASLTVDANKEIAVAALMQSALNNNVDTCVLRTCPLSYVLQNEQGIDFFNMAIHLPGILKWGDISLAAGLNKRAQLTFIDPAAINGNKIIGKQLSLYKERFTKMQAAYHSKTNILFEN